MSMQERLFRPALNLLDNSSSYKFIASIASQAQECGELVIRNRCHIIYFMHANINIIASYKVHIATYIYIAMCNLH